jgi:hypothetical protein
MLSVQFPQNRRSCGNYQIEKNHLECARNTSQ